MALNTPQSVQPGTTIELLSKYHNFRCESELQNPKGDYLRALINLNFADDVFKGTDDILTLSLVSAAENTAEGFGKELTDILAEVNQLRQAADMPPLENLFHPNQLAVRCKTFSNSKVQKWPTVNFIFQTRNNAERPRAATVKVILILPSNWLENLVNPSGKMTWVRIFLIALLVRKNLYLSTLAA